MQKITTKIAIDRNILSNPGIINHKYRKRKKNERIKKKQSIFSATDYNLNTVFVYNKQVMTLGKKKECNV